MRRRASRSLTLAVVAATFGGTFLSGAAAASAQSTSPHPAPSGTRHSVLDHTGRAVEAGTLALANRNAATLDRLRAQGRLGAAAHRAATVDRTGVNGSGLPRVLPPALERRRHDKTGYLAIPGLQPPTARTFSTASRPLTTSVKTTAAASAGTIAGVVTDAVSHGPVAGACATAYGTGSVTASGCTDATGAYSITGLLPGTYFVSVEDHVSSHQTAYVDGVAVTSGATHGGVDVALAEGASAAGLVTDGSSTPLAGVCVTLYDSAGDSSTDGGCTDGTGHYQTVGVPPGSYTAQFRDFNGPYEQQFYSGKLTFGTADRFSLTLNAVHTGVDAALAHGGSISGTVSDGSSAAAGVCGDVVDAGSSSVVGTVVCSDGTGHYTTTGLAAGSYLLDFSDPHGNYLEAWYGGATAAAAVPVTVTAGADTGGKDVVVPRAGKVSGLVVDSVTHDPLPNVCVSPVAYGFVACTGLDGHYTLGGFDTGTAHLVYDDNSGSGYLERFYGDADTSPGSGIAVSRGATATATDEHLLLGGSITGHVVDSNGGAPLANVCVSVSPTGAATTSGWACTDATGAFTAVGLQTGAYTLQYVDNSGLGYLTRYYHDADAAPGSTLAVTQGSTASALDEHLDLGGTISGTVTAAVGGAPVTTSVRVLNGDIQLGWASSDAAGHYTVVGLDTGSYTVEFGDDGVFLPLWYAAAATQAAAQPVPVTRGNPTTSIDGAVHRAGIIAGTVTDASSHAVVAGVCVTVTAGASWAGSDCTAADGTYQVGGLADGDYTVAFDGTSQNYLAQTYPSLVHAAADTTATADAALATGATITGSITDAANHLLSYADNGACADAEDNNGTSVGYAECADASGHYRILGLPTGSFAVHFAASDFVDEYYDNVATLAQAQPVAVTVGSTMPGIDASLAPAGHLSGHVTDAATGLAPADTSTLHVDVYDGSGVVVGSTNVAPNGSYLVTNLRPGSYTVQFGDWNNVYFPQWYAHADSMATATPVPVVSGGTATGVDAALSTGGAITGLVTEGSGQPLQGVCVQAFAPTDVYNAVASGCTDATGTYRVGGLAGGTYLVEFVDTAGPYLAQWANGRPDSASADFISVTLGGTTPDVNATMAVGATVSGTITDATTGLPVADACVWPSYSVNGYYSTARCSDANGNYRTSGLPAGSYSLTYSGPSGAYLLTTNTQATLTDGQELTGQNVALQTGGRISGTVTNSDGSIPWTYVSLYDAATDASVGSVLTDSSTGDYTSDVLPAGSYKVDFGGLWWDNQPDQASATPVTVTAGSTATGISGVLPVGPAAPGGITGTITDAATHAPLSGICASASPTGGTGNWGWACTDANGVYTISNLGADTYTVSFDGGAYLSGAYTDGVTNPTPVTVGTTTVTGIDGQLTRGATIKGTVTDAATHAALANVCVDVMAVGTQSSLVSVCTDNSGHYQTTGLAGGDYQVEFSNTQGRYLTQWYDGAATQATATTASLTTGVDTTIDQGLVLGAAVSGTVTDAGTSGALSGICVQFHDAGTNAVVGYPTCTDASGHYAAVIPAGSYKVEFSDGSGTYSGQWWNGKPDVASADTLTVSAGSSHPGINAAMQVPSVPPGTVSGTVSDGSHAPVQGASVILCPSGSQVCQTQTTDAAGAYSFSAPAGSVDLTAYPPANSGLEWAHTSASVTSSATTTVDLTLAAPTPLPTGVSVDGQTSGTPTVFWDSPIDLAADGCAGGTATYTMTDAAGTTIASGSLTEGPAGHFTVTVPPQTPNRGAMDVSIAFTCPNAADNSTAGFTLYIDPSGVVSDTHAAPVIGATVTLLRSDAATGPFTQVANGDGSVMSPSNQANPSTTDAVGHYGWDVVAGYYKVTASKAHCYAPGSYDPVAHTVQPVVASAVQTIPPAVTNLDLTLDCTNLAPVAAFTQSVTSGHPGVSVHLDAGSAVDPNGSVASYHWDFGDGVTQTTASATVDHVYNAIGAYTPTLTVVDDQGASSVLKSGSLVTVADAPGQVTGLSAVSGLHSVALSWTAPASNGSPITGYTVDVSPGGQHLTPTGTGVTVTGLNGNTFYTFAVRAVNAFGTGAAGNALGVAGATGTHPSVAITAAPPAYTNQTAGQLSFAVAVDPSVSLASVTCAVDGQAASSCSSPFTAAGLAQGAHSVVVTAIDSDGNQGSASTTWVVDTTRPTAATLKPAAATTLSRSIPVAWSGGDLNGVASYDVRYARAAWNSRLGAPTLWKSATKARSATFTGALGSEYCFSVRARDLAGNVSGWTAPKCTAVPLDDRQLGIGAGWRKLTVRGAFMSTYLQAATKGATLTRPGVVTGRVALVATRAPGMGVVGVYYNGTLVKQVSLAYPVTRRQTVFVLPKFTARSGTITVKSLSGKTVQIDGLLTARV